MTFMTDGIIIREQTTGEQDRLVTILTRSKGVIKGFVNGGRNPKNKNVSSTGLLCYSDFTIEKTKKDKGHFITEKEVRDLAKAQKEKEITDIENCISEIEKGFAILENIKKTERILTLG